MNKSLKNIVIFIEKLNNNNDKSFFSQDDINEKYDDIRDCVEFEKKIYFLTEEALKIDVNNIGLVTEKFVYLHMYFGDLMWTLKDLSKDIENKIIGVYGKKYKNDFVFSYKADKKLIDKNLKNIMAFIEKLNMVVGNGRIFSQQQIIEYNKIIEKCIITQYVLKLLTKELLLIDVKNIDLAIGQLVVVDTNLRDIINYFEQIYAMITTMIRKYSLAREVN